MSTIELNNHYVRLYGVEKVQALSKKPKLVFLHGLMGNSQNWASIASQFAETFDVLTYDLRGHGRTGVFDQKSYEPETFAHDLKGILDELSWEKVNLVGHSLGGRILMVFGSLFPECVAKLVIEDMGPHKTDKSSRGTEEMIGFVPVPFESRAEARAFFHEQFEPRYGKTLSDYLYGNLVKNDQGLMNWRFDKAGILKCLEIGQKNDFWSSYKSIKSKHLIVRGQHSEHLPSDVMKKMLESNAFAEAVEISEAGHWVHFDQRAHFVEQLTKFFI